jgi:thiol:disulfide interchange protein DsbD
MPTVLFIDRRGKEVPGRITGAVDAEEMLSRLGKVDEACAPAAVACVMRW